MPEISFLHDYIVLKTSERIDVLNLDLADQVVEDIRKACYYTFLIPFIPHLWLFHQAYKSTDSFTSESEAFPQGILRKLLISNVMSFAERFPELWTTSLTAVESFLDGITTSLWELESSRRSDFRIRDITGFTPLGDSHEGRCVFRIGFADGRTYIYKPRSICGEVFWCEFADRITRDRICDLVAPQIIYDGKNFGVIEDIRPAGLANRSEVSDFYRRSGMMLLWFWLFGAKDIVRSNIIASGLTPVLVDAETLFYPSKIRQVQTVLDTGMLPQMQLTMKKGAVMCTSALCPFGFHITYGPVLKRSEAKGFVFKIDGFHPPHSFNIPKVHGEFIYCDSFLDEITNGFLEAASIAKKFSKNITRWINELAPKTHRFVVLPTVIYTAFLLKNLTNGWRKVEFDKLPYSDTVHSLERKVRLSLYTSDISALSKLSIPRHEVYTEGKTVKLKKANVIIGNYVSGVYTSIKRLNELTELQLEKQIFHIRNSMALRTAPSH